MALWVLLLRVFGLDWRLAAMLALTVPAAPYSVGFSGHPAYMAFFPALGMVSIDALLRERRAHIAALLGALAGLSFAGFVLVLYVPWQIGLLYLMLPFAAAVIWERRTGLVWGQSQVIAAVVALCVAVCVLGVWWWSARDALATIAATVYPGQRATTVGGDIDPWFLIKGMMSPITMYASSPLMDQSDAGSYVFLLVPLLIAVPLQWVIRRRIDGVSLTLVAFVVWTLTYMFHGFSVEVAELSFWGRATSYRMDLPLGVAQVLLIAWFIRARQGTGNYGWIRWNWIAGTIAVLAVIYSGLMVWRLPVQIGMLLPPSIIVISGLVFGAVIYLLLSGRSFVAIGILCVWMVGAALPFNPISQSPTYVRAPPALLQYLPLAKALDERRIAIIDEHGWTVTAVAVGIPIANTVMYYPQTSLWQGLDPAGAERTLYNRYQHLLFVSTALPQGAPYRIESQRLDAVRVLIDPDRFDFRMLGVAHILTTNHLALDLGKNPSLQREATNERWSLYRVVR